MIPPWILSVGSALAQSTPSDPPADHPRHIIIPDPLEGMEEPRSSGGRGQGRSIKRSTEPTVPPRIARKVPRPVEGEVPVNLYGRYHIVEITEAGVTEDYANKMERAGRALNDDCLTLRYIFDSGPLPVVEGEEIEGHRPIELELTRIQRCDVGGLGTYAEESTLVLRPIWTEGEASVTLQLPSMAMNTDYVRLKAPSDGNMRTPQQWLSPTSTLATGGITYLLIAEPARRGALPVLHLTTGDKVLHLEADPGDSPFDQVEEPDAQAAAP